MATWKKCEAEVLVDKNGWVRAIIVPDNSNRDACIVDQIGTGEKSVNRVVSEEEVAKYKRAIKTDIEASGYK